ncbi:MAG: hypothetical protein ABR978_09520, partial [Dehalococcoidia bacterium]
MRSASFRVMILLGLVAASVLAGALAVNCGGGEKESGEKTTATAAATATARAAPTPVPSPTPDIRSIDLSQQSDVAALTQRLGGEVDPETIIYSDLTGDGRDEAVVPISSGGTAGDPAFIVLGYSDGKLVPLLTEVPAEGSVQVAVVNQQLVESVPVYSAGDLPGFPTQIKKLYYAWNGSSFVIAKEQTVPNPSQPPK